MTNKSEENDLDGCWWLGRIRGKEIRLLSGSHKGELVRSVDLFSGSGGFSLGVSAAAEELGLKMKSMAAVDIDEHALEVFRANHAARIIRNCSVTELVDYSVQIDAENYSFFNTPEIADEQFEKLVGCVELVLEGHLVRAFKPQQSHSSQRSSKLLVRTCCRHGPSSWRKGCSYRERSGRSKGPWRCRELDKRPD